MFLARRTQISYKSYHNWHAQKSSKSHRTLTPLKVIFNRIFFQLCQKVLNFVTQDLLFWPIVVWSQSSMLRINSSRKICGLAHRYQVAVFSVTKHNFAVLEKNYDLLLPWCHQFVPCWSPSSRCVPFCSVLNAKCKWCCFLRIFCFVSNVARWQLLLIVLKLYPVRRVKLSWS